MYTAYERRVLLYPEAQPLFKIELNFSLILILILILIGSNSNSSTHTTQNVQRSSKPHPQLPAMASTSKRPASSGSELSDEDVPLVSRSQFLYLYTQSPICPTPFSYDYLSPPFTSRPTHSLHHHHLLLADQAL